MTAAGRRAPGGTLLGGLGVGALIGLVARDLDLPGLVSYWGDRAPLVAACTLGAALLWRTRLRRPLGALACVLAALWLAAAFTPLTRLMGRDLVRRDRLASADAIVVLGSGMQADGEFSPAAESRLVHALTLVAGGSSQRLVLSELPAPRASYAAPARALMERLGVRAELLVVGPVRNTRDEATAVARLCRERGFARLVLVTSPVHSRRASEAFEREGLVVSSSPAVETRYDLEAGGSDSRLGGFGDALHERVGLLVYRWRGFLR